MEKLRQIKKLLKEDGYSIAGAKRFLMNDDLQGLPEFESTQDMVQRITSMIRKELIQELAIGQSLEKV
jgi:DNA-binding transcriptional MerR regulator